MKVQWRISLFYIVLFLAYLTFQSYKNRVYDWDMPGYIGCLYETEFSDSQVHQLTYDVIKKEASPTQFKDISGLLYPNKAIQYIKKDSRAFNEQLPYYQIKVGYNFFVSLLYEAGFSAPISVLLVSVVSYFLVGLLLFFLMKTIFPKNSFVAALLTTLLLIFPTMWEMSTIPTPDMLSLLFMLLFVTALIKNYSDKIIFYILLFLVLIRPDYIIFALTYLFAKTFYNFIKKNKFNYHILYQFFILIGVYLFIINYFDYPGWKDVFYDTFIRKRPVISAEVADFSFKEYLNIIFEKLIMFKKVTLAVVTLLLLIFYFSKDLWVRILSALFFINLYLKFLIFPQSAVLRFYFCYLLLLFIMLLYSMSRSYGKLKLKKLLNFVN